MEEVVATRWRRWWQKAGLSGQKKEEECRHLHAVDFKVVQSGQRVRGIADALKMDNSVFAADAEGVERRAAALHLLGLEKNDFVDWSHAGKYLLRNMSEMRFDELGVRWSLGVQRRGASRTETFASEYATGNPVACTTLQGTGGRTGTEGPNRVRWLRSWVKSCAISGVLRESMLIPGNLLTLSLSVLPCRGTSCSARCARAACAPDAYSIKAVVGFLKTNLKMSQKKNGLSTAEGGGILDAGDATAKAEQVEEVGYSGGFVVDIGDVKHTTGTTQLYHLHHRRHVSEGLRGGHRHSRWQRLNQARGKRAWWQAD